MMKHFCPDGLFQDDCAPTHSTQGLTEQYDSLSMTFVHHLFIKLTPELVIGGKGTLRAGRQSIA